MKFLLDPVALNGQKKFWVLQFETVWSAAGAEVGIVQGEVKAGTSHPDFGKSWDKLTPAVREFISRLCVLRSFHFAELASTGELRTLIEVGIGKIEKDPAFEELVARRLHNDWVTLRALLYTAYDDTTRQTLIAGGLKPFGDHEGDKSWDEETEAQQGNDRRLVYRLGWLLDYCEKSEDAELSAYFTSLFTSQL